MKVKTFHALTMQDALRAIKDELGPDAIILSSKEVREGGRLLRVFNRPVLEVMAASEREPPEPSRVGGTAQPSAVSVRTSGAKPLSPMPAETFQQTLKGLLGPNQVPAITSAEKQATSLKPSIASVKKSRRRHWRTVYDELGRVLQDLSRGATPSIPGRSPFLAHVLRSWCEQGMSSATIEMLLSEAQKTARGADLSDDQWMRRALQEEIARRLPISGPLLHGDGRPAVSLLIGPSGAGKTSAVAKLAAYYRLEQRKSVALITFDTYRETAVEQLRRYAKIVGVPFACALSARQVHEGLRRHAQVDLVIIDMPGIESNDLALAKDLRHLLKQGTITTHLVLPASTREQEATRIARRVEDLPKLCLLFTKLDETASLGTMFEVSHSTGVPLSYWSIGRRVPGDIEVAAPERLAARLTMCIADGRERISHWIQPAEAMSALTGTGNHHG